MTLAHRLRKITQKIGIDAQRYTERTSWELRAPFLLHRYGIQTVLDIGANDGDYASNILSGGFRGSVLSFEPLPDAWTRLSARASKHPRWKVARRVAISDECGTANFIQSENSVSSSLLMMSDSHLSAAPQSRAVQTIEVDTETLDDFLSNHACPRPLFLKIDVQGAEMLVLKGAHRSLMGDIRGVQLEMSLGVLYEGQCLYWQLDEFLRSAGFQCCDIVPEFRDPTTLSLLQFDATYFKA
jgi:FkbM family methyltransferase